MPRLIARNLPLGSTPPGTVLKFTISEGDSFEANAILQLESQPILRWVSSQIVGNTQTVTLVTPGLYQLQVTCPFTTNSPSTIQMDFEIEANGTPLFATGETFDGQRDDVARTIADVTVL